ncbi:MAG: chemotaxis protein CheW [Phormidesmis sp.]
MNSATHKTLPQAMFGPNDEATPDVTQYLTFRVADYLLALPSQQILRIVATPTPDQGGLVGLGLVQLAQYSIQIIDLVKLLELQVASYSRHSELSISKLQARSFTADDTEHPSPTAAQNPPFLIVLQADQNLWGIAVHEPPDLMAIPSYALKPIPSQQRQTRALRWVSHVVTYDLANNRHSLPVLDLSDLFL